MGFEVGQHLQAICWPNDVMIKVGESCDDIVVIMEHGQMAGVPWFGVIKNGQVVSKWNAALCEGVLYKEEATDAVL